MQQEGLGSETFRKPTKQPTDGYETDCYEGLLEKFNFPRIVAGTSTLV